MPPQFGVSAYPFGSLSHPSTVRSPNSVNSIDRPATVLASTTVTAATAPSGRSVTMSQSRDFITEEGGMVEYRNYFRPVIPTGISVGTKSHQDIVTVGMYFSTRFKLTARLGEGGQGSVYLAEDIRSGDKYALKVMTVATTADAIPFQRRELELHTMASTHENVVTMYAYFKTEHLIFAFLQYCDAGDLFNYIVGKNDPDTYPENAKNLFLDIIAAVKHCHEMEIYHRDLKSENILLRWHNGKLTALVADFGMATQQERSVEFGVGSGFYMAPECATEDYDTELVGNLRTQRQNGGYVCARLDEWGMGIMLVNLATRRNLWQKAVMDDPVFKAYYQSHIMLNKREDGRLSKQAKDYLNELLPLSAWARRIVYELLCPEPTFRMSLQRLENEVTACHHEHFQAWQDPQRRLQDVGVWLPMLYPASQHQLWLGQATKPVPANFVDVYTPEKFIDTTRSQVPQQLQHSLNQAVGYWGDLNNIYASLQQTTGPNYSFDKQDEIARLRVQLDQAAAERNRIIANLQLQGTFVITGSDGNVYTCQMEDGALAMPLVPTNPTRMVGSPQMGASYIQPMNPNFMAAASEAGPVELLSQPHLGAAARSFSKGSTDENDSYDAFGFPAWALSGAPVFRRLFGGNLAPYSHLAPVYSFN